MQTSLWTCIHGNACVCVLRLMCVCTLTLLSKDPIPNVRQRICRLMPALKKVLQLPAHYAAVDKLQTCMKHLTTDPDPGVQRYSEEMALVVGQIKVKHKFSGSKLVRRMSKERAVYVISLCCSCKLRSVSQCRGR